MNLSLSKAIPCPTNAAAWTIKTAAGSIVKSSEVLEIVPRGRGMQESAWLCAFGDSLGRMGQG